MIELIFILIVVEIVVGIYMVMYMERKIRLTEEVNRNLKKIGFSGNLTEIKVNLRILNAKLRAILTEKTAQEQVDKIDKLAGIFNFVLLFFSIFKFMRRKKNFFSKHK